ncbi:MAG: GNAT family N-acetyltransferase [Gemmataceae bacterium]|nr:GNAT family N-acetyltransferase [Gemmataceae bacterium]
MIRPGTPADLPAIDAFDPFGDSRADEVAAGRLAVYERDGRAVGFLTVATDALLGHPFVSYLAVAPEARRQGVGSALLADAERRHTGLRLLISTEETNAPMRALLTARGYTVSGVLHGLNQDGPAEVFYYKDC